MVVFELSVSVVPLVWLVEILCCVLSIPYVGVRFGGFCQLCCIRLIRDDLKTRRCGLSCGHRKGEILVLLLLDPVILVLSLFSVFFVGIVMSVVGLDQV